MNPYLEKNAQVLPELEHMPHSGNVHDDLKDVWDVGQGGKVVEVHGVNEGL